MVSLASRTLEDYASSNDKRKSLKIPCENEKIGFELVESKSASNSNPLRARFSPGTFSQASSSSNASSPMQNCLQCGDVSFRCSSGQIVETADKELLL